MGRPAYSPVEYDWSESESCGCWIEEKGEGSRPAFAGPGLASWYERVRGYETLRSLDHVVEAGI